MGQNEPFVNRQVSCTKVVWECDTLCRTVWMQTSQESKRQYGWTESSTFLALPPKQGFPPAASTCHQKWACFWLLNISGSGSGPAVWSRIRGGQFIRQRLFRENPKSRGTFEQTTRPQAQTPETRKTKKGQHFALSSVKDKAPDGPIRGGQCIRQKLVQTEP